MQDRLRNADIDSFSKLNRVALKTLDQQAKQLPLSSGAVQWSPIEQYVTRMQAAVLTPDKSALDDIVADMRQSKIAACDIADLYIPTVARRLGECWVQDTLNFSAVSIGSARLQSLLWQLEAIWSVGNTEVCTPHTDILLVIPDGCQHTLGASVLAGQLRRLGFCVQLEANVNRPVLIHLLQAKAFAAVMISASSRESVETLKNLVRTARRENATIPILIGGNVLDRPEDIALATGADLATSDIQTALAYCGLDDSVDVATSLRQVG